MSINDFNPDKNIGPSLSLPDLGRLTRAGGETLPPTTFEKPNRLRGGCASSQVLAAAVTLRFTLSLNESE